MAAGELKRLDKRQRALLEEAISRAEGGTGLQFCVFLGTIDDDRPRDHAEALFAEAGLHERPAILVVVAPKQRQVEIVTGPHARRRISDADAGAAVATMTAAFAQGDLLGGLVDGIEHLATVAGPGERGPGEVDIADIVDEGSG